MASSPKPKKTQGSNKPKSFKLQKKLRASLPEHERAAADEHLWKKSGGLCALCNRPLVASEAEPDHRIATSDGGADELANLYLAHRTCNRSRGNLRYEVARPLVAFKAFADEREGVTFDDVLDEYRESASLPSRKLFALSRTDGSITIEWGTTSVTSPVFTDPATGVEYFFVEAPIEYVCNDVEVQPRQIMHHHVRALAVDFVSRPVHEPSNARLVFHSEATAQLLQFDGQHKTTAQLLLGRLAVPMKVYIEPEISMVQALVLKIQQEIKKQPLTKSDTLAKLGDVMKRRLEAYATETPPPRTEKGFVEFQLASERKSVSKEYMSELYRLIFFDDDNLLREQVRPGSKSPPTTDKVIVERVIRPFVFTGLLDSDMEQEADRDQEREMVVLVLNTMVKKMLPAAWNAPGNELAKRRAQNFFYQASIGWWMEQLLLALRYVTQRIEDRKPLFIGDLSQTQRDQVVGVVEKLCDLDIWSTDDEDVLKAMRSNTVKNLAPYLANYSWKSLLP